MSYALLILRSAQRALEQLSTEDYERLRNAMFSLAENARPAGCAKLTGRDGWRIRSGEYRVIYQPQ